MGILHDIVTGLAQKGIYTILDMHQDVLWKAGEDDNWGYWGVPPWIKHTLSPPQEYFPYPMAKISAWPCGYFTEEISRGFQQIYNNSNETAELLAQFWRILAREFKDEPSILGYELINEPWGGNVHENAAFLLPGVAGRRNLGPLYEKLHSAIREIDDETIVFWEPVTWALTTYVKPNPIMDNALEALLSNYTIMDALYPLGLFCGKMENNSGFSSRNSKDLVNRISEIISQVQSDGETTTETGNPSVFGPGLRSVPGGPAYLNRTVMSWHYYCFALGYGNGSDLPYDLGLKELCHTLLGPSAFDAKGRRMPELAPKGFRSASMLTEFGLCKPDVKFPDSQNTQECQWVMKTAEEIGESWTYWDTAQGTAFWTADGRDLNKDVVAFFARPFPVSSAGIHVNSTFDVFTKKFYYAFDLTSTDDRDEVVAEIFLPKMHYSDFVRNFDVSSTSDLLCSLSSVGNLLVRRNLSHLWEAHHTSWIRINPRLHIIVN